MIGAGDAAGLRQRVSRPDARPRRLRAPPVPRRRLPGRVARRLHVRVPEPHRLGDRDPGVDRRRRDHLDAGLVRPAVQRDVCRRRRAWARQGLESFRLWREERRKAQQRREVLVKYGKKDAAVPRRPTRPRRSRRRSSKPEPVAARDRAARAMPRPGRRRAGGRGHPHAAGREEGAADERRSAPSLPLPEPERNVERRLGSYTLPPVSLLDAPKAERKIDERELMESARLLEEKCREFSVEGSVVQIHPGPVVTTFEFKPDAGVKYSKVTGLSDDLCLAMQAESVLIDRIPGKATVGIQIPNPEPRSDLAARAAGVRHLHAVDLEADLRARQDHSRRAVHGRPGDHAAPADRRLDRLGQVGRASTPFSPASSTARPRTMCG